MQTQLEVSERLGEATAQTADLRTEVARMSALVEDLLVLARLDADSPPRRTSEVSALTTIIDDVTLHHPQVRLLTSPVEWHGAVVRGPGDELRRAVQNVVSNAVRHATRVVEIHVEVHDSFVDLCVCDDGAGIPPADRERVFERFTRLDEGRARDAGGSGLGLAIVRELVRRNGGEVTLEDAPRGGLQARIRLKRA
jgi:signal transduction histidine kinase